MPAIFANGGLRSFASLNAFVGIFDGNVQMNGDIFVPGADCAEHVDVAAGQQIEAGSVVVIHQDGTVRTSERAYDKKVAGVISGAGAFGAVIGNALDNPHSGTGLIRILVCLQ